MLIDPFERIPPQSLESEMAVLGSMLISNDCIDSVTEELIPEDFYRSAHRKICRAIFSLHDQNTPADLITVSDKLKIERVLDEIGGSYYLTELIEAVPSAADVLHYVEILKERARARRLIEQAARTVQSCYEGDPVDEIIDRSEQQLTELGEDRKQRPFRKVSSLMVDTFEIIEKNAHNKGLITGVSTGFTKLDELTAGLQPAELTVIAGRPSHGKSGIALNIAANACKNNISVGFFSLEMSARSLVIRLLCAEALVDSHAVRTGRLAAEDMQKLAQSTGAVSNMPLFIDDTSGIDLFELKAKARRMKKTHNTGLYIIDYAQIMTLPNAENLDRQLGLVSYGLKAMAKELDAPVVVLSQLSRDCEKRGGDKRPILSDLRYSGAIEQDADMVGFIYRAEMYHTPRDAQAKGLVGKAELILAKNRNGPTGTVNLSFLKQYTLFKDYIEEGGDYVMGY